MRLGRRALGAAVLVIAAACTPPTPPEEPTLAETLGLPSDTPLLDVACAPVAGVCTSSIQAQVDAVPAGTTAIVRVAAGQYRESVRISAKSVHLVGAGAASTIIDGTGLTPVAGSTRFGVVVAQAPNSSVRRLTVRNFSAMDHDHFRSALRAESTAGVVFEDVTVADNSYAGIGLSEASGARLTRVTAAGNDAIGIAAYRANGLVLTDSLVAGNTDTLRYQDEQEQYRESAGFKTTESHNVLVTKSTFRDNGSTGVWTDVGTSDSVISFNTVVNNKWHGIETEISDHITVANNTVLHNADGTSTFADSRHGILVLDSSNIRVENNIVRHRRGITDLGWSQALRLAETEFRPVHPAIGQPPTDTVGVVIVGNTVEELAPTGSVLGFYDALGEHGAIDMLAQADGNTYRRATGALLGTDSTGVGTVAWIGFSQDNAVALAQWRAWRCASVCREQASTLGGL